MRKPVKKCDCGLKSVATIAGVETCERHRYQTQVRADRLVAFFTQK